MSRKVIPAGAKFGSLKVIRDGGTSGGYSVSVCRCKCGKEAIVKNTNLLTGNTTRCVSCARREGATKHGLSKSPTWQSWMRMKTRCDNPNGSAPHRYVGRGISMHPAWREFSTFLRDMGERPSLKHSLDRVDNDGNYEPGNCRWATPRQQANNTSRNVLVWAFGEEKSLADWSRDQRCACSYSVLQRRVSAGWDPEEAVTLPAKLGNHARVKPCSKEAK